MDATCNRILPNRRPHDLTAHGNVSGQSYVYGNQLHEYSVAKSGTEDNRYHFKVRDGEGAIPSKDCFVGPPKPTQLLVVGVYASHSFDIGFSSSWVPTEFAAGTAASTPNTSESSGSELTIDSHALRFSPIQLFASVHRVHGCCYQISVDRRLRPPNYHSNRCFARLSASDGRGKCIDFPVTAHYPKP